VRSGGSSIRIDLTPSRLFGFALRLLCSVETERASELQKFLRSSSLVYGVFSLRAEDIKMAINWFNKTYVISFPFLLTMVKSEGVLGDSPDSLQMQIG